MYKPHQEISHTPNLEAQNLKKINTIKFKVPLKFYLHTNKGKQALFQNTVHSGCGKLLNKYSL